MPHTKLKLEDVPRYEALIEAIKKAYGDMSKGRYRLKDLTLVAILTFTGCRLGEALALRVRDLDLEAQTVRVRQLKKTYEMLRVVPVPSELFWEIIKRYLRRLPYPDTKLFDITERQARNIVYKFTKRYLKRKIRPHAVRHSYATYLLRKMRDLEVVRRLLGHEDYRTIKAYLNYTQEDLKQDLRGVWKELGV